MNARRFCLLLTITLFATATVAEAKVHTVSPGESIQAAIDAADPGDTILVEPGTYQETGNALYGLHITTDDLRLIAKGTKKAKKFKRAKSKSKKNKSKSSKRSKAKSKGKKKKGKKKSAPASKVRLLHYGTQETGVYAAPPGCNYKDSDCPAVLNDFYIRGFSVEGFPVNGIQTRWVDGFEFHKNESINNLNNGIYPTLSANGLVQENVSYGSLDTAMWVAGSEHVRVIGNEVFDSVIGYEITVSNDVYSAHNDIHDNVVGVGLFHPNAAGNPPLPVMADWVFENNRIHNNNLSPNPAPPGSFQAGVPPGAGVLILGVDGHVIRNNRVENNGTFGIAVAGWCTAVGIGDPSRNCFNDPPDPSDDPPANGNLIELNQVVNNGTSPDPALAALAADLTYVHLLEGNGVGNCFQNNVFTTHFASPGPALPVDGCL